MMKALPEEHFISMTPEMRLRLLLLMKEQVLGSHLIRESIDGYLQEADSTLAEVGLVQTLKDSERKKLAGPDRTTLSQRATQARVNAYCLEVYSVVRSYEEDGRLLYPIFFQLPTQKELPEYYKTIRKVGLCNTVVNI
jgi:hypothetical protein